MSEDIAKESIDDRFFKLSLQAGQIFNPNTPVKEKELFSGRKNQIRRVVDVIFQRGQHAIIFGERGVGKTSLANILQEFLPTPKGISCTRINCDREDDFTSVWRKVFNGMRLMKHENSVGFMPNERSKIFDANSLIIFEDNVPEQIRQALLTISETFVSTIVIIDEFDRLDKYVRSLFADFIKSLSDYDIDATIVLIGVGSSIEDLVNEHKSVSRSLVEIQMPRMEQKEIEDIIILSLERLGMNIGNETLKNIKTLSKGLPHYTHLIGLHATRDALDKYSLFISAENLNAAIEKAIEDGQHSIRTNYHNAIRSTKKDNLFADVLLACALAQVNELGEFAAQDLRSPMLRITGKAYKIPAYAQHLNEFSEIKRGNILIKTGERKRYRYKFSDPLMQPFTIMQGMMRGRDCQ
jgi:Cdc6-like AAA superfamily ATPase